MIKRLAKQFPSMQGVNILYVPGVCVNVIEGLRSTVMVQKVVFEISLVKAIFYSDDFRQINTMSIYSELTVSFKHL